jgi:hypothetical protein
MLAAHLVPGYFAAVRSQSKWKPEWSTGQRTLLWVAALGSTFLPDADVIYNTLFRGFINHSVLWTHSLLVHFGIGLCWWLLRLFGRWPYLQTLVGLVAIGGLSHLALDVIAHNTPLFYPVTLVMIGVAPVRIVEGGVWAYLTDPLFLLEPLLLTLVAVHWTLHHESMRQLRRITLVVLASGLGLFVLAFLLFLPMLQNIAASL